MRNEGGSNWTTRKAAVADSGVSEIRSAASTRKIEYGALDIRTMAFTRTVDSGFPDIRPIYSLTRALSYTEQL